MKKFALVLMVLALALVFASCTIVAPVTATSNSVGSKVGEATTTLILGIPIPLSQNGGVKVAAKNGGISKISTVDLKVYYIGPFYMKITTVVSGD